MMKSKKIKAIAWLFLMGLGLGSCSRYLDLKPDKTMAIPTTLADCQALLDDYNTMNMGYPGDGEAAADNYYLTTARWTAISDVRARSNYIWDANSPVVMQWSSSYKAIYYANQVLAVLDGIDADSDIDAFSLVKGSACFYRAYALHQLACVFAPPYDPDKAEVLMGVPARISADIDVPSKRGTLAETYIQIIEDLIISARLLPTQSSEKSRPSKAAAFAALARVYLDMGRYDEARSYADTSFQINSQLIDFNCKSSAKSGHVILKS